MGRSRWCSNRGTDYRPRHRYHFTMTTDIDASDLRDRLRVVDDPALGTDIVTAGVLLDVTITDDTAEIELALGAPHAPDEAAIADQIRDVVAETGLTCELSANVPLIDDHETSVMPGVRNVIVVASGKGGVGKSTVAVNLAAGLAERGADVGLFDADVYGPNVPRMVDSDDGPEATEDRTLIPPERYGIQLMSMDFLVGPDDPVIWRGPMVHKMLTQLVEDVEWGQLDYLVVALPPGTGDTQLT